jgi:hypothetical protein
VRLGNPNITAEVRAKGVAAGLAARQQKAAARAADLQLIMAQI